MIDCDEPTAGYYRVRLVRGAPPTGARIWFGPPADPLTGELLDRSWRWQAEAGGRYVELDRIWPGCMREPIDEKEYRFLTVRREYAVDHDPHDAMASPNRRVDWETCSPPSF